LKPRPAFQLADLGYDVWLGNFRGNTYSRKHVSLDPNDLPYWNFSWDEIGNYDIPAVIEYIRRKTGQTKLIYMGHSLGATVFFIAMIKHPELNAQIEMMIALSPSSSLTYYSNYLRILFPFVKQIQVIVKLLRIRGVLERTGMYNTITQIFCDEYYFLEYLCRENYMKLAGPVDGPPPLDLSFMPLIHGHYPAGGSFNTMVQFAQNSNAGSTLHTMIIFIVHDNRAS